MDLVRDHMRNDGTALSTVSEMGTRAGAAPAFKVDIARSVRMRPWLAAGVGAVVFVAVVGFALTRKPMYQAESLTYVEPLSSKVLSDGSEGNYDPSRYDSYLQQQIQTATRPDILEAAIAKLPPGTWQQPGEDIHAAADRLGAALKVARVGTSYQLAISMMGANAAQTAAVVNAATDAYLEKGRKDEHARADGRQVLLTEESQRIQAELQQDRDEQKTLAATLGVADPVGATANPYDVQLGGLREELVAAQQAHDVAAAQLASVSGPQSQGLKSVADEAIATDPGLGSLKATINQRRAALNSQMAGYTPANPVYKQDQEELAELDRQVAAREQQLRAGAEQHVEQKLRLELQRTGDVESRLNGQLAHAIAQAGNAAPKLQRASELAADIARLQLRYATVDDALRGLALETNGPGTAHLAVAASVPTAPEASKRGLLLGLSLPLALLAGIGAAVFARKRDPLVYTAHDVEELLGFLPLGVMPSSYEVSDAVMEEFLLRLAAGLERAYRVSHARSFVFTGTSASTQVSGFVAEIQRKLQELGFKAVALDAGEALRMNQEVGGGVEIMRSRPAHGESFAMSKLEGLKQDNHFVLISAQPLLHSAEAEYAVSSADATILVIESAGTTSVDVMQTGRLLRRLKASGVGVVLHDLLMKYGPAEFRASIEAIEQRPERAVHVRQRLDAVEETMSTTPNEVTAESARLEEVVRPAAAAERRVRPEVTVHERQARAAFVEAQREEIRVAAPVVQRLEIALVAQETEPVVTLPQIVLVEQAPVEIAVEPDAKEESEVMHFSEAMPVEASREDVKQAVVAEAAELVAAEVKTAPPTLHAQAAVRVQRMMVWEASIKQRAKVPAPVIESVKADVVEAPVAPAKSIGPAADPEKEPVVAATVAPVSLVESESTQAELKMDVQQPVGESVEESLVEVTVPVTKTTQEILLEQSEPAELDESTVAPWAPRAERRRAPRILQYPQVPSRMVQPMSLRRDMRAGGLSGAPRMTPAEQAVAQSISRRRQEASEARLESPNPPSVAPEPRRWGLLSRFDTELPNARLMTRELESKDRAAAG